jgi:hypothetical protein
MKCDLWEGCKQCEDVPEWHMVAGTTKCEDIIDQHFCEAHMRYLTARTNLPHSISDPHEHTMDEVIFSHLFIDMPPVVYVNDTPYPCKSCDREYLDIEKSAECELLHTMEKLVISRTNIITCHICKKVYSTLGEASDCAFRDQQTAAARATYKKKFYKKFTKGIGEK